MRTFRWLVGALGVFLYVGCGTADSTSTPEVSSAGNEAAEKAAVQVASAWLHLVDTEQYAESWKQSASLFQRAVPQAKWEKAVADARRPFGSFIKRELMNAELHRSLPGAPDGEYVVIQFRATYQNKQAAVETVTPMREDGVWKVSGYFIK